MLEKGMQKTRKVFQNGGKLGTEIEKKPVKNEVRKTMRKRAHMQDGSAACGGRLLKTYHLFSSRLSSRPYVVSRFRTSCNASRSRLSCQVTQLSPNLCVYQARLGIIGIL